MELIPEDRRRAVVRAWCKGLQLWLVLTIGGYLLVGLPVGCTLERTFRGEVESVVRAVIFELASFKGIALIAFFVSVAYAANEFGASTNRPQEFVDLRKELEAQAQRTFSKQGSPDDGMDSMPGQSG